MSNKSPQHLNSNTKGTLLTMNIIIPIHKDTKDTSPLSIHPYPLNSVDIHPLIYYSLDFLSQVNKFQKIHLFISYNIKLKKNLFEENIRKDYPQLQIQFNCYEKSFKDITDNLENTLKQFSCLKDTSPFICMTENTSYHKDIIPSLLSLYKKNFISYYNQPSKKDDSNIQINKEDDTLQSISSLNQPSLKLAKINGFSQIKIFQTHFKTLKSQKNNTPSFSNIYDHILKSNQKVHTLHIKKHQITPLETAHQINTYIKNNKQTHFKKRICFDLDNTLVSYPQIQGDYKTVQPIEKNIEILNLLKKRGHTIIIYTARRMKTYKGDVQKAIKEIGTLTQQQLKDFNITYDELIFGKPDADIYIDDKALNRFQNLENNLGIHI